MFSLLRIHAEGQHHDGCRWARPGRRLSHGRQRQLIPIGARLGPPAEDPEDLLDLFLTFNYDVMYYNQVFNAQIIPRGMEQLDYTLGGADYEGGAYNNGAANADNGAADLIHGESGDDIIFGLPRR